jgi:hypothetical protein
MQKAESVKMNKDSWDEWRVSDANEMLRIAGYNKKDRKVVLDWFYTMSEGDELNLIGESGLSAMERFVTSKNTFNVYNSLMSRLFIYAPLILNNKQTVRIAS